MKSLTVLYLAANPRRTERLRLDEEIRQIEDRVRGAPYDARFEINAAWAVRVKDLARAIEETSPTVVHFSGHAESDGIVLEGDEGEPVLVPVHALADLFRIHGDGIRCVVLNACFTEVQARAIANHIPYVIGTRPQVRDEDAISFAERFYWSVANGHDLAHALEEGANEIELRGGEPDVHQAYAHDGIDPSKLVLLQPRSRLPWIGVALLAFGAVAFGAWLLLSPADAGPTYLNTELILDSSTAMREELPDSEGNSKSKLLVATNRLSTYVGPRGADNLALRVAQGCDAPGELAVPFQTNAVGPINTALDQVTAAQAGFPLTNAVIAASADFNDPEQFPPASTRRQILIVTSGTSFCESDAAELLQERWEELGDDVGLKVDFVGLGASDEATRELRTLAATVNGRTWFVNNEQQLNELLDYLMDLEPVIDASNAIGDVGNEIVTPLNAFRSAMNKCEASTARDELPKARSAVVKAGPALDSLESRDSREQYIRIHEAGRVWADRLAVLFAADEDWLAALGDVDVFLPDDECDELRRTEAWGALVDAHNEAVSNANSALGEFRDLKSELTDQAPDLTD